MTLASKAIKVLQTYEDRRRSRGAVEEAWEKALRGEVNFWDRELTTWRRMNERMDGESVLQDEFAQLIQAPKGATVELLDVGAGALTWVNKKHPDYDIRVTAVDALGKEYQGVYERVGIKPPVITEACETERLTERFAENTFDVSFARNTLDHSYDPVKAILQMIAVTKPNGAILLAHARDEAEEEKYRGLHQWNFRIDDGEFVIWRPGVRHVVREEVRAVASLESVTPGAGKLDRVLLRKHA